MKTIAFFNNKGGVGKTTLVYHLAWMYAEKGIRTLAVDLDPQSNLSSMFLADSQLEELWPAERPHRSVLSSINPLLEATGDFESPPVETIAKDLFLISGDLGLSKFEDRLSGNWSKCLDGDVAAFRNITAFYRLMLQAAKKMEVEYVLVDVGPNLGAINRAALIACDHVVMPLAPGLFSLQGLRNLGPTLEEWRKGWKRRLEEKPSSLDIPMPSGRMGPLGYIILQHAERKNRPVKAFQKWVVKIPATYREYILNDKSDFLEADPDPNLIGLIKNYQSLMPMAQDARKPIFRLKPADGAIGAHAEAVSRCYVDFEKLADEIAKRSGSADSRLA